MVKNHSGDICGAPERTGCVAESCLKMKKEERKFRASGLPGT